ncbi:hypothetical protein ALP8811_00049 [Aliiroseovarius pelagivivens]|uniref:Uncharacterized protein n=1 Tax=Aliiroseovarius pelagivivens TaxID=1639690 RepID=A0A2R8AGB7_9RHOB|nr:hypothetical protein [Aliiroseovarius pelagivivens]SPF75065.1 hypothetical protein ALP8811_00049 [Aliiroseovarius pelagivivens]
MRWAAGAILTLALAGCFGGTKSDDVRNSPLFSKQAPSASGSLVQRRTVMSGAVTVAAPKGYCVDVSSLRDQASGAFVPFGACAALTRNVADPSPKTPAFLVASVSALPTAVVSSAEDPEALMEQARAFLESAAGRAALSRSGDASTVTVLDLKIASGVVKVLTRDSSDNRPASLSDTTWRAFLSIGDKLVVASVTGFTKHPIDPRNSLTQLDKFITAIKGVNPASGNNGGGLGGIFRKLRN